MTMISLSPSRGRGLGNLQSSKQLKNDSQLTKKPHGESAELKGEKRSSAAACAVLCPSSSIYFFLSLHKGDKWHLI